MRRRPNPVAGAAAERCPVVADDPADMILDGSASRELGRDRRGREAPPVGESLTDWGATRPPDEPLPSPENRSHGDSGRCGAGWAESEAVGSPVTRELDPRRGRSTPGFELPAEVLDVLALEDRARRWVETLAINAERPAAARRPMSARVRKLSGGPAPALRALSGTAAEPGPFPCRLTRGCPWLSARTSIVSPEAPTARPVDLDGQSFPIRR